MEDIEAMEDIEEIIVTVKPETRAEALNELVRLDGKTRVIEWFDGGIARVKLSAGYKHLVAAMSEQPPIFLQHVFPIHQQLSLQNDAADMEPIAQAAETFLPLVDAAQTFSIQTRIVNVEDETYRPLDVNNAIAPIFEAGGVQLDVSNPQQIVSILVTDGRAFMGFSPPDANLSSWAGGRRRFLREEDRVSRAEFKLLEAIEVFHIDTSEFTTALDLGAAPGGWTRVLVNCGLRVIAVDPAQLDPAVTVIEQVKHFRGTAQSYLRAHASASFDMIVNDMRMDVDESVALMNEMSPLLSHHGCAVMTLKLRKKGAQKTVRRVLDSLAQHYHIVGVKQLFHNRSEVTVVLSKT